MSERARKSRIRYFAILGAYFILGLVVVIAALTFLWKYASSYEMSVDSHVISEYMTELNETKWNDAIKAAADGLETEFQNAQECETKVRDFLDDGIIVYYMTTGGKVDFTKEQYNLFCQDELIGNFTIRQDTSKPAKFDLYPWELTEQNFDFSFLKTESYSITVPSNYKVVLNGAELTENYITEKGIHFDALSPYYDQYKDLPTKVTYTVEGLVGKPEAQILDASGQPFEIDSTQSDLQFIEPCPDDVLNELEGFADEFMDAYLNYFGTSHVDSTLPALKKFIKPGSELMERVNSAVDGLYWSHTNYLDINEKRFDNAFSLGGGFYVIEMTVSGVGHADYKTVDETTTYKITVCKDNNGILAVAVE